jgi:hypothetical protein
MPVIAGPAVRHGSGMVQADFILAGAAVPDRQGAFAVALQIFPQRGLVTARRPAIEGYG